MPILQNSGNKKQFLQKEFFKKIKFLRNSENETETIFLLQIRNPTPDKVSFEFGKHSMSYYDIGNDGIVIRNDSNRERIGFWDDIFDEFKQQWNINFNFSSF